jgi:hypothetical protein
VAEQNWTHHDAVDWGAAASELLSHVQTTLRLTAAQTRKLQERLWKFSAHVRQPRKDDRSCNKTPYFDRWDTHPQTSHLTTADPRYASAEECKRAYETLLALLLEADEISEPPSQAIALVEKVLGRSFQPRSLSCVHTGQAISGDDAKRALDYTTSRLGSYEISTSYRVELDAGGRHEHTNVSWMKPLHVNYALRKTLHAHLAESGAQREAINNALDKIQVKSYCTDKQTMPPHFSNRDVRWATWPDSVQYASRYQCVMVEMELMAQLYEFADAPPLDAEVASAIAAVRGQPITPGTRRCYVTGRYLSYQDYLQAAINPKGGKSAYHVGHVLPLTRGGKHQWHNIAWMSDDGNRIQGNDTLEEIEDKLIDAVAYHLRRDRAMDNPPPGFYDKVARLSALLDEIKPTSA